MNDLSNTVEQGTFRYMTPEITTKSYGQKVDVFSFGILIFELFCGPIFDGENDLEVHHLLHSGKRPKIPNYVLPWISNLISICWSQLASERSSFVEIIDQIRGNEPKLLEEFEFMFLKMKSKKEILKFVKSMKIQHQAEVHALQQQQLKKANNPPKIEKLLVMDIKDFHDISRLGNSIDGSWYRMKNIKDNIEYVVVKTEITCDPSVDLSPQMGNQFKLIHPNLLHIVGYCLSHACNYTFFEDIQDFAFLSPEMATKLHEKQKVSILLQIATRLQFLTSIQSRMTRMAAL